MISDLYDAVCHAFRAYGCPAEVYLGEQWRAQHTGTMRVVMWQGKDSPPDQFGPQTASSILPTQALQFINPRPVATRRAGFSVELWATAPPQRDPADQFRANQAWLDALVNHFCVVLQQKASGIFEVVGGVAAAGNGDAVAAGLGYEMQCYCDVPIIDAPWPAQQLSECSKTWHYGQGTAEITVQAQTHSDPVEYTTSPPTFVAPTPPEE